MAKILFHRHAVQRYNERIKEAEVNGGDKWYGNPELEKEILMKGSFFENPERPGNGFYCIVKNTTVYAGFVDSDGTLRVLTTYPYRQSMRGYIVKLGKLDLGVVREFREDLEARIEAAKEGQLPQVQAATQLNISDVKDPRGAR
jgi:hypothetical protein